MNKEFCAFLGAFVIVGVILYVFRKWLKLHVNIVEGLTNQETSSSSTSSSSGVAAGSTNYESNLKNQVTQLQDTILVSKYRKEYESIILSMDDYINTLMLQTVLNINPSASSASDNLESFKTLNALNESKTALNNVMKYIDSS
jgi:hypothetical protein